ncbi:shikimate kinase [Flagellimonas pacifica]|uniref:Shikimate kinase n=1 Tax=Flagellimonas pacifica TaxID=1247520 RepID=A0A285MXT5_9FLAO|nr:shikimate kinase [Allomuricauda parva]SNZ02030.1 shikimate kinase [Allomuricauda parva]
MKVVLVGYMASGKSSVGRLLAKQLGAKFIDLDSYIEEHQKKTIRAIFSENGEIFFRKLEHKMLQKVLNENESVLLSTGGGTPCYSNNMDTILKNSNHSIYLQLSVSALVERISKEKDQRPLVKDLEDHELPEFIGKHIFERRQYYELAKHIISCDKKELEEVVAEIEDLLL